MNVVGRCICIPLALYQPTIQANQITVLRETILFQVTLDPDAQLVID
jgi:hypothetical protein